MIGPILRSILIGDVREPPSLTSDSGHISQTGPPGDRAMEDPRLRVFENWVLFGVSYFICVNLSFALKLYYLDLS